MKGAEGPLKSSPARRAVLISGALLLCAYVYSLGGFQREAGATIADIRITVRQRAPVEPRRALGSDAELLREAAATVLALQQAGEAAKQEAAAAAAEKQAAKQAGKQAAAAGKAAEAAAAAAQPAAAAEAKPAAAEAKPAAFPGSTPAADAATDDVAAAVLAGAGVHGFVDKAGPLDPRLWRGAHKGVRDKRLLAWMLQRRKALDAGKPAPPLPLTSSCQVWVNHKLRVLYVRHAKTGSSSLLCHFSGCRGEGGADTSFVPLEGMSGEELARLWQEYLVVTFVRNPWTRAVSAYRMMQRNLAPGAAARTGYGWNQFCADPAGFVGQCLRDARCRSKGPLFVLSHIQPQAHCLRAEGNAGWAVDFIGRTEHLDEDLAAVLAELEQRRPDGAPQVQQLGHALENVNGRGCKETAQGTRSAAPEQYCDAADYFRGQHAACFKAVQQAYRRDVDRLRYGAAAAAAAGAAADDEDNE